MASSPDITFEEIRERAYDLWERHHRPEGYNIEFWLMAERELRAERGTRADAPKVARHKPAAPATRESKAEAPGEPALPVAS